MLPIAERFEYEHRGCDIVFGRGSIDRIGEYLADRGLERALLVCGSNVGSNDELLAPIESGLGDRLEDVFTGTTPEKRVETAFGVLDRIDELNADVIVGVGGGSSLDIARQSSALATDERTLPELKTAAADGTVSPPPTGGSVPVVVVPTTFTGADFSSDGSLELLSAADSPTEQPVRISGSVMPIADFADPNLFETTPKRVLTGSALNGFNKGIETPYARDANPVSDATAVHGVRLLQEALPRVVSDERTGSDSSSERTNAVDRAVVGSLLVQLDRKISILHAVGHGFTRRYPVQQGDVHAVIVPHVLEYLFENVDANRAVLADGLGVDPSDKTDEELAAAIVGAVEELRDALDAPKRLRELPETQSEELRAVAEFIVDDSPMARTPNGLEATVSEIERVLRAAW